MMRSSAGSGSSLRPMQNALGYFRRPRDEMSLMARYRMYTLYGRQILATFTLTVVILATAFSGTGGPPIAFIALWIAIAIWNGYWFLFRIAYHLEVNDQTLRWRAPFRQGTVSLLDISELRPSRFGSNIELFELASGTRSLVFVRKGFRAFADELVELRPGLPVRLGLQARLFERMPGWTGFREDRR